VAEKSSVKIAEDEKESRRKWMLSLEQSWNIHACIQNAILNTPKQLSQSVSGRSIAVAL